MTIPRTRRYPRRPIVKPTVQRVLPSVEQMYRWARNRTPEAEAYMTALAEGRVVERTLSAAELVVLRRLAAKALPAAITVERPRSTVNVDSDDSR